jgi:hypothetical protein
MSSFDPATVRKAVEEFTPRRRPQKFQDLLPAKDVIVELRQKRASDRATLLATSKTAIAMSAHQVLGKNVRPRNLTVNEANRPFYLRPPTRPRARQATGTHQPVEPQANANGDEAQASATKLESTVTNVRCCFVSWAAGRPCLPDDRTPSTPQTARSSRAGHPDFAASATGFRLRLGGGCFTPATFCYALLSALRSTGSFAPRANTQTEAGVLVNSDGTISIRDGSSMSSRLHEAKTR